MNPFLSNELAGEHIRDLREQAARTGRQHDEERQNTDDRSGELTVRRFTENDIDAIRYLAALDGKSVPSGAVLVAELDGELVAALSLGDGNVLADPFKRTADIVSLLQLRSSQLRRPVATRRLPLRLPSRLLAS